MTDGVSTGKNGVSGFIHALRNRHQIDKIFVSIMGLTDEQDAIGYLNDIDENVKNVDVSEEYLKEKKKVKLVNGQKFPFSFGDYIVKVLLGAIDPYFDNLNSRSNGPNGGGCCTLL